MAIQLTVSPIVALALARIRVPAFVVLMALMIADAWLEFVPAPWLVVWLVTMVLVVVLLRVGTLQRPAVALQSPVGGRWKIYNSPATWVPSHGVQSYGQCTQQ